MTGSLILLGWTIPPAQAFFIAGAGELKQWSISCENINSVSAGGAPVDFQPIAENFRASASDASIMLVGSIAA
jgi:hypothetical protein